MSVSLGQHYLIIFDPVLENLWTRTTQTKVRVYGNEESLAALTPPTQPGRTGVVVAEGRAGTVAAPAVREAEVARLTAVTLAADHVRLAGTLAAERRALETL